MDIVRRDPCFQCVDKHPELDGRRRNHGALNNKPRQRTGRGQPSLQQIITPEVLMLDSDFDSNPEPKASVSSITPGSDLHLQLALKLHCRWETRNDCAQDQLRIDQYRPRLSPIHSQPPSLYSCLYSSYLYTLSATYVTKSQAYPSSWC